MAHVDGRSPISHLDGEAIESAARGEVTPAMRWHLKACSRCRSRVEEARSLLALLGLLGEAGVLAGSHRWFRSRALAALRQLRQRGGSFQGFLRCTYDSLIGSYPAGARGPTGPGRQIHFEGAEYELDVLLIPPSEESPGSITGQVMPRSARSRALDLARLNVRARDGSGRDISLAPDGFGMFSMRGDWRAPIEISIAGGSEPLEAFVPSAGDIDADLSK
jgi:hypothetical protein